MSKLSILCITLLLASGTAMAEGQDKLQQNPDSSVPSSDIQQQRMQNTEQSNEYKDTNAKPVKIQKLRQKPDANNKKQPYTNTHDSMIKGKDQKDSAAEGGVDVKQ